MRGTWLVRLFRPELLTLLSVLLVIGSLLGEDAVAPEMRTALLGVAAMWAWSALLLKRRQPRTDDRK
jgi:hypothetical protein